MIHHFLPNLENLRDILLKHCSTLCLPLNTNTNKKQTQLTSENLGITSTMILNNFPVQNHPFKITYRQLNGHLFNLGCSLLGENHTAFMEHPVALHWWHYLHKKNILLHFPYVPSLSRSSRTIQSANYSITHTQPSPHNFIHIRRTPWYKAYYYTYSQRFLLTF